LNIHAILFQLDLEIAKLEQAKALLTTDKAPGKKAPGRPKKAAVVGSSKKRQISPEGRARIAAAQKKRWAAAKRATVVTS
jgi:hypothetical protein